MALADPSDWPRSMPDLRAIDNLLRCSICFEYLNVAMILPSCSHNYCSLCIRRYLKYKQQCPSCNMEVTTSELCNNRTLDDLVKTFVMVRPFILKLCKQSEESQSPVETGDDEDSAPSTQRTNPLQRQVTTARQSSKKSPSSSGAGCVTKIRGSSATYENELLESAGDGRPLRRLRPPAPRDDSISALSTHKISDDESDDFATSSSDDDVTYIDSVKHPVPSRKTRLSRRHTSDCRSQAASSHVTSPDVSKATPGRSQTTPRRSSTTPVRSLTIHGSTSTDPGRSQIMPSQSLTTPSRSLTTPSRTLTTPSAGEATPSGSKTTPNGSREKAECPVCGVPVSTKHINLHLDACLKRSDETQTTKRDVKRKRIPGMLWKLVPDRDLKKRMKDYGLSTKGKRHELVKRVEEFILRYNAQCDAANPKTVEQIAKEVEEMEQRNAQPQQLNQGQVNRLKIEKGFSEEEINRARQECLLKNKDHFNQMAAEMRRRMQNAKKMKKPEESQGEASSSSQTTASSVTSVSPIQESVVIVVETKEGGGASQGSGVEPGVSAAEKGSEPGAEADGAGSVVLDGSASKDDDDRDGIEKAQSGMDATERPMDASPVADPVVVSDGEVPQDSGSQVLAPSSPSVASREETDGKPSCQMDNSGGKRLATPQSQEILCIPESPLTAVAEPRRRKRKTHDYGSLHSDSGSSMGDEDATLRRSKRERKTAKN